MEGVVGLLYVFVGFFEELEEDDFVAALVEFFEEFVDFREDEFVVVGADELLELAEFVLHFVEAEDVTDVLVKGEFPLVEVVLQREEDTSGLAGQSVHRLYLHCYQ